MAYTNPFVNEPTKDEKKEECILCGSSWYSHEGWLCPKEPSRTYYEKVRFDIKQIPREYRFWTPSMREAAANGKYNQLKCHIHHDVKEVVKDEPPVSEPAWKQFQHKAPGECACGIARVDCKYHR